MDEFASIRDSVVAPRIELGAARLSAEHGPPALDDLLLFFGTNATPSPRIDGSAQFVQDMKKARCRMDTGLCMIRKSVIRVSPLDWTRSKLNRELIHDISISIQVSLIVQLIRIHDFGSITCDNVERSEVRSYINRRAAKRRVRRF